MMEGKERGVSGWINFIFVIQWGKDVFCKFFVSLVDVMESSYIRIIVM